MLEPVTCRCCGQAIHPRDNAGTGDLPLCLTCLEDRYTACARCGTLIPNHQAATCRQVLTRMSPTVRTAT